MNLLPLRPPTISLFPSQTHSIPKLHFRNPRFQVSCSSIQSEPGQIKSESATSRTEYKPGVLDDLFLSLFRNKLVQEVGRDSEKPGYDGLIELVNRLVMKGKTNSDTRDAAVRILVSLFPPLVLKLYKILISPMYEGKIAAMMVARVTALTCQWLMGPCTVNSVDLPDGTSCQSGVFVERCKYLEESKCIGVCINTCKLPTQTFFKDYMGVPLLMEPNFSDYSCQVTILISLCSTREQRLSPYLTKVYRKSAKSSYPTEIEREQEQLLYYLPSKLQQRDHLTRISLPQLGALKCNCCLRHFTI